MPAVFILRKSRKEILVCCLFIIIAASFLIFGTIKNNQFVLLNEIKHDYTIRVVSPNISLERFYSNQDESKIIKELIVLTNPQRNQPTIFLWPEGIISESYLNDMKKL